MKFSTFIFYDKEVLHPHCFVGFDSLKACIEFAEDCKLPFMPSDAIIRQKAILQLFAWIKRPDLQMQLQMFSEQYPFMISFSLRGCTWDEIWTTCGHGRWPSNCSNKKLQMLYSYIHNNIRSCECGWGYNQMGEVSSEIKSRFSNMILGIVHDYSELCAIAESNDLLYMDLVQTFYGI